MFDRCLDKVSIVRSKALFSFVYCLELFIIIVLDSILEFLINSKCVDYCKIEFVSCLSRIWVVSESFFVVVKIDMV